MESCPLVCFWTADKIYHLSSKDYSSCLEKHACYVVFAMFDGHNQLSSIAVLTHLVPEPTHHTNGGAFW